MKTLVLGGTGLLGQAMMQEAGSRGWPVQSAARSGADLSVDISDPNALAAIMDAAAPELVVNCAALVDIGQCEADPGLAYRINARPAALLAEWSRKSGGRLVHISTDHYYLTGGNTPHREAEPVVLVNEYARSKFAAEGFALNAPGALVLRTSIVGNRGWARPTFAEWALQVVTGNAPVTLFTDAYTSSIDVGSFARAALDLAVRPAAGLLNLAAAQVYSKADFVQEIAAQLDRRLDHVTLGSVDSLNPPRPSSLGLDVSQAQALLDFELPMLPDVVKALLSDHTKRIIP